MELKEFFKLLPKYKYVLILVPLVTIIISFFLVRKLESEYVSSAKIATGIVDQSRQILDPATANQQETKISGDFSNLIEVMKLKKMIDEVSYKLIIHDLTDDAPFRKFKPGKSFPNMTVEDRDHALSVFKDKLRSLEPLSLNDNYEDGLNNMLIGMGYDERTLRKIIVITHDDFSDFISVSCTTEEPRLSAYIVNELCTGFIAYHTAIVKDNETDAINYLTKLLEDKHRALDSITNKLQDYKIENNIINLDDQSKSISNQLITYQDKRLQEQQNMESAQGAIAGIDKKFDPKDRQYIDAGISKMNLAVLSDEQRVDRLNDDYVRSGFDPKLKRAVDSVQRQLDAKLVELQDKYIVNPLNGKEDLVRAKMQQEINYDLAKSSINAIDAQVNRLNNEFRKLVPLGATEKTYNFAIDIASKEYQDVLNKYNQTNLQSVSGSNKLIQIEKATPEVALPSKKMQLVVLSGIISFVFCVIVLFILFYFDDAIKEPMHLANKTNLPVLGALNQISGPPVDMTRMWDVEYMDRMHQFKDLMRSVRFEIDQELKGEKVLAITSLGDGEGKSLLAMSLAYSYSVINKKVLLIDGNFNNPSITDHIRPRMFVEDVFKNSIADQRLDSSVNVLGNRGEDITPLEIGSEQYIRQRFDEMRRLYDVILIEAPSIDAMNKSKEWMLFADKTIAVFEADRNITNGKKQSVKYLQNMHDKFAGWVINKAVLKSGRRKR